MPYSLALKLAPYAVLAALLAFAGYKIYGYGEAHVQAQFDAYIQVEQKAVILQQQKNQIILQAEIQKRTQAEVDRDTNQAIVDSLSSHINGLSVHIPNRCAVSSNNPAGANQSAASGVVPTDVDGLFAEFQRRTSEIIKRCDELNIDAIRMNKQTN